MAQAPSAADDTGRLDLVPMIDCIMLLLMFFIMTSSFRSEEQRISALLSTKGGPGPGIAIAQPQLVRVVALPGKGGSARVRIGGGDEVTLDGATLALPGGPVVEAAITAFHAAMAARLTPYEQPGARSAQPPVEIHCATRLPWRDALAIYDAVRAYEATRLSGADVALVDQRQVAFGAPGLRRSPGDSEFAELELLERLR